MKANHIQKSSGAEVHRWIAASNGVKKLGPKEGRTKQVGDVRLTWKATGEDTGYATSFYEMDLPTGKGIPLHSHPYAEVFYVVMDTLTSCGSMSRVKKSGCAAVQGTLSSLQ
jgi:hypothetical protein